MVPGWRESIPAAQGGNSSAVYPPIDSHPYFASAGRAPTSLPGPWSCLLEHPLSVAIERESRLAAVSRPDNMQSIASASSPALLPSERIARASARCALMAHNSRRVSQNSAAASRRMKLPTSKAASSCNCGCEWRLVQRFADSLIFAHQHIGSRGGEPFEDLEIGRRNR